MDTPLLALALSGAAIAPLVWSYLSQNKYHPGPQPLPIIGNLLQLPRETPWVVYQNWSNIYGPCIHLEAVGQHILIVNEYKDAEVLLSKRGFQNSERPHLFMAGDLLEFGRGLALLPYDQDARESRKLIHFSVGSKNLHFHHDLLASETMRYLRGLRDSPDNWVGHLTYTAGAIILKIAYGYDVLPKGDPLVALANEALDKFSRTTILGEFPVDIFPFLRYLPSWTPGLEFKKLAKEWKHLANDLFDKPFNIVKERMREGTAQPSFSSQQLESIPISEWDDDHTIGTRAELIKATAASLYAGASDTTMSAMRSFFLAMTIYPDNVQKAQEEIDVVIGNDRLPQLDDRPYLPFCNRLVKEVLRWGVVGPLGIPHVSKEDAEYNGRFIRKGTLILPNIWGMLHDEKRYPNPHTFNPDRFLDKNQPDPAPITFGFGKRSCPGSRLAQASIFLAISQTLALFYIKRIRDENGNEVIPPAEFITGTISRPKLFQCNIVPRKCVRLDLIEEEEEISSAQGAKDS